MPPTGDVLWDAWLRAYCLNLLVTHLVTEVNSGYCLLNLCKAHSTNTSICISALLQICQITDYVWPKTKDKIIEILYQRTHRATKSKYSVYFPAVFIFRSPLKSPVRSDSGTESYHKAHNMCDSISKGTCTHLRTPTLSDKNNVYQDGRKGMQLSDENIYPACLEPWVWSLTWGMGRKLRQETEGDPQADTLLYNKVGIFLEGQMYSEGLRSLDVYSTPRTFFRQHTASPLPSVAILHYSAWTRVSFVTLYSASDKTGTF